MAAKIGGKNFDITLGDLSVHVEACTLDITDNTAVSQTRGVPNGHVEGDVGAAGEMEFDTTNFNLLIEAAKTAGSFRSLEPFDSVFFAKAGEEELRSNPRARSAKLRGAERTAAPARDDDVQAAWPTLRSVFGEG